MEDIEGSCDFLEMQEIIETATHEGFNPFSYECSEEFFCCSEIAGKINLLFTVPNGAL